MEMRSCLVVLVVRNYVSERHKVICSEAVNQF